MLSELLAKFIRLKINSRIIKTELIQKLWSDYGQLLRVYIDNGKSLIAKDIDLAPKDSHPRNWNTNASHQRKLKSYQVEINWYINSDKLRDKHSYFPKLISSLNQENKIIILLEDLDSAGYSKRISTPTINEIKLCINWLASFHAKGFAYKTQGIW